MSQPQKPLDKSITAEEIEILNKCIYRTDALRFNKFLSSKATPKLTYIQSLKGLLKILKYDNFNTNIPTDLVEGNQMQVVIDFFHSLSPELGIQVEDIFSKKQNTYDFKLVSNPDDDTFGLNFVKENSRNERLKINVTFIQDITSMLSLAHELSHAISNRTVTSFELLQEAHQDSFYGYVELFHKKSSVPQIDCTLEIESHITELLFLQALVNIGYLTKEQFKNFIIERNNSFKTNIVNIVSEYEALEMLGYPVSFTSFAKFADYSEEKHPYLLKRIKEKIELEQKDNRNSEYAKQKFRYVIAEIVSTVWFDIFSKTTKGEKRKMIKKFVTFLQNNALIDLKTSVSDLLDMSIEELGNHFYALTAKENEDKLEF